MQKRLQSSTLKNNSILKFNISNFHKICKRENQQVKNLNLFLGVDNKY